MSAAQIRLRSRLLSLSLLSLGVASGVSLVGLGWAATAPKTTRVSVSSAGAEAEGYSGFQSISANGRFVAFYSLASNLVEGDRNGRGDVFIRDRKTSTTTRVSVTFAGAEANRDSQMSSLSADGRIVAFSSSASNLVPGDGISEPEIFVRDRRTGETTRVSVSSTGAEANPPCCSSSPSISADGRFVAFYSDALNFVQGDRNGALDVFVHDRMTGKTTRISTSSSEVEGNDGSHSPSISANGRFVSFSSDASNLVRRDRNGETDVFVHNRRTGKTTRVSVNSAEAEVKVGAGGFDTSSISANGRFVAFSSGAPRLVRGDHNGCADVFVRDRRIGKTTRVSVNSMGAESRDPGFLVCSRGPSISADGRFVTFYSAAVNLVRADRNHVADVFLRDRRLGKTTRVSLSSAGVEGELKSFNPSISADGRFVAFGSEAQNLVPGDLGAYPDTDVFVRGPLR